jgi:hypothetical protein
VGQILDTVERTLCIDQAVPDVLDVWADRNGCAPTQSDTRVSSDTANLTFSCPADIGLPGHACPPPSVR